MIETNNVARHAMRIVGQIVKEIIGRILVGTGLHRSLLKGTAIVVAFHSITREKSTGALRCSVEDLEAYCRFFVSHLKPETLTRTVERLRGQVPHVGGELAITFDDGYADNAELALPVLTRWSLPATFYVTTGFIGSRTQTDWDKKANIESCWMGWEQVRELVAAGHDIGAHTVTHIDLATASAYEAESELRQSRDDIAAHTGAVSAHFAIPYGRNFAAMDQLIGIASRLRFSSVTLCRGGVVPNGTSPMRIERWPINPVAYLSPYGWLLDVWRTSRSQRQALR